MSNVENGRTLNQVLRKSMGFPLPTGDAKCQPSGSRERDVRRMREEERRMRGEDEEKRGADTRGAGEWEENRGEEKRGEE